MPIGGAFGVTIAQSTSFLADFFFFVFFFFFAASRLLDLKISLGEVEEEGEEIREEGEGQL